MDLANIFMLLNKTQKDRETGKVLLKKEKYMPMCDRVIYSFVSYVNCLFTTMDGKQGINSKFN